MVFGSSHTYLFFGALIRSSRNARKLPKNNIQDFYIQSTVDFIESYYMNEISVEDMASNLGLNRSYFSKIFKENMGCPPQEFLIRLRLSKATVMMKSSGASIGGIAAMCGYPNQLHFSRAFKNVVGASPSQWRIAHSPQSVGRPPEK